MAKSLRFRCKRRVLLCFQVTEKKKPPSKHAETVWFSFIKNYKDEDTTFFSWLNLRLCKLKCLSVPLSLRLQRAHNSHHLEGIFQKNSSLFIFISLINKHNTDRRVFLKVIDRFVFFQKRKCGKLGTKYTVMHLQNREPFKGSRKPHKTEEFYSRKDKSPVRQGSERPRLSLRFSSALGVGRRPC